MSDWRGARVLPTKPDRPERVLAGCAHQPGSQRGAERGAVDNCGDRRCGPVFKGAGRSQGSRRPVPRPSLIPALLNRHALGETLRAPVARAEKVWLRRYRMASEGQIRSHRSASGHVARGVSNGLPHSWPVPLPAGVDRRARREPKNLYPDTHLDHLRLAELKTDCCSSSKLFSFAMRPNGLLPRRVGDRSKPYEPRVSCRVSQGKSRTVERGPRLEPVRTLGHRPRRLA